MVILRLFIELRGFAPIGMLEQWNDGIMGFGQMGHRLIGKTPLDSEVHKRVSFP
jgi:hypothetical protein